MIEFHDFDPTRRYHGVRDNPGYRWCIGCQKMVTVDFWPWHQSHDPRQASDSHPFSRPTPKPDLSFLDGMSPEEFKNMPMIEYRDLFSTYQLDTNSFGPVLKQSRYGDYRTRFIYALDPDEAAKFLEWMLDEVTLDHPDLADAMFTVGIKPKYFDTYDLKVRWISYIGACLVVAIMIIMVVLV